MKKIIFAVLICLLMVVTMARAAFMEVEIFGWENDERISIEFEEASEYFGPEEYITIGDQYEVQIEYKDDYSGGWIVMIENVPDEYGYLYKVLYESGIEPMNMGELGMKIDELVKEGLKLLDEKEPCSIERL